MKNMTQWYVVGGAVREDCMKARCAKERVGRGEASGVARAVDGKERTELLKHRFLRKVSSIRPGLASGE